MPNASAKTPRLRAPPHACDTHMHVYNHQYPKAATAKIDPPDAPVAAYLKVRERLGVSRTVVVQPTTYGKDNRCTLAAMSEIGPSARGVAVVDDLTPNGEMERLSALGIRGVRFFMLPGGPLPWDLLELMAARVSDYGWHVQLQLDGRELPQYESMLSGLSGDLVIDHTGKFLEPVSPDHPSFRTLLRLVENGKTWVKLSAPYETAKKGPPYYDDVGALAKALVKAAPERMLWATNWPHPSAGESKPDDADMLDLLLDWAQDDKTRTMILADNPARLYDF